MSPTWWPRAIEHGVIGARSQPPLRLRIVRIPAMSSKQVPRQKVIRSKIVGVTFDNPDGTSRQVIIDRYCDAGMTLKVRPEPNNPVQENALGLWVQRHGLFGSRSFQVGYVRSELADEFRELLARGWEISGQILEVT